MERTVADLIIAALAAEGIDVVFGVPGAFVAPFFAALSRSSLKLVTARSDAHAVWLAAGYAHARGLPGVALVSAGPGTTSTLTAMATARAERWPVLLLGGDVATTASGRAALHGGAVDVVALLGPVCKFARSVPRAAVAPGLLRRAFETARSGVPGPTFLAVPHDVASSTAPGTRIAGHAAVHWNVGSLACAEAFSLIVNAERPLLVAGAGLRPWSERIALATLVEATGVPVATTPKGKGVFPEDHPYHLGVIGYGGHDAVAAYVKEGVDVVIAAGTGLSDVATNAWTPLLRAGGTLVHVDVDADVFGRGYEPDLALLGRFGEVVEHMLEAAGAPSKRPPPPRALTQTTSPPAPSKTPGFVSGAALMGALNRLAPPTTRYVVDIGEHLAFALHHLRVGEDQEFLTCLGFGAPGASIPVGIGAALAQPHRRVVVLCGDGGALLTSAELDTARRLRVPVTFVIANDARQTLAVHELRERYGVDWDFNPGATVDFVGVASALGVPAVCVGDDFAVEAALRLAFSMPGPMVLDVRVDATVHAGGVPVYVGAPPSVEPRAPVAVDGDTRDER